MTDDTPPATPVGPIALCHHRVPAGRPAAPRPARDAALRALAAQTWRHPLTEHPVGFGFSTIERWYYPLRHEDRDPVGVLRRQRRRDAGHSWALSLKLREVLRAQYQAHPSWTYQLHTDDLAVQVAADAALSGMRLITMDELGGGTLIYGNALIGLMPAFPAGPPAVPLPGWFDAPAIERRLAE